VANKKLLAALDTLKKYFVGHLIRKKLINLIVAQNPAFGTKPDFNGKIASK
jgi:hypothetical protein